MSSSFSINDLLGGAPLLQPRPESQLEFTTTLSKKDRSALSADKLLKIKELACSGISNKFTGIEPQLTSSKKLETAYDIGLRLFELRKSMIEMDMEDVFNILSPQDIQALTSNQVPLIGNVTTTNLFDCFGKITVEEVKESNKYYSQYGLRFTVENLVWSEARVLNSLEPRLQSKILDKLRATPAVSRGGPLALKLALDVILDLTPDNLHAMSEAIRTLKLADFPGEHIGKAIAYLRGTILILRNCKSLMDDNSLFYLLYQLFKSASSKDFVAYVHQVYLNHVEKLNVLTIDQLFDKLESQYTSIYNLGLWDAAKHDSDSVFFVHNKSSGKDKDLSGVTCFRCNQKGHYANRCPSADSKPSGKPLPVATVDRTPPGKNQSHERTASNGVVELWCGHCQVWTNHAKNTPECPSSRNKVNLASGDPPQTVPPTTPTAATATIPPVAPTPVTSTVGTAVDAQPGAGVAMTSLITRLQRTGY
jgi:hypothetical protein